MDNDERTSRSGEGPRISAGLVAGLSLMAFGLLFTLGNLGLADVRRYLRYWPAIIVAVALAKIAEAGPRLGPMIWLGVGTWLLLGKLGLVPDEFWRAWPGLAILLVGGHLVHRSIRPVRPPSGSAGPDDVVRMFAVLGGFNRVTSSKSFRGGDLAAFMGGCELDLRQAEAADGQAVLDVVVVMGGIEIRVPEGWTVAIEAIPFMGGFEDKTHAPAEGAKARLLIRGLVMMGGLEVKN